jgi:hypothetical protein
MPTSRLKQIQQNERASTTKITDHYTEGRSETVVKAAELSCWFCKFFDGKRKTRQ